MITSTFGRLFLDAYNEKYGTQYDAKTFFVEQYWPLFFDHNKYMISGGNTKFENPKIGWDKMLNGTVPYESSDKRKERLDGYFTLINEGIRDNRVSLDRPSANIEQATSCQVTNIEIENNEDDVLLSWIGISLALGVHDGTDIRYTHEKPTTLLVLFRNKYLLLDIFEGWKIYREVLNSNTNLKGNCIHAWNSVWIAHRYDELSYDKSNPLIGFDYIDNNKTKLKIKTLTWTNVLFPIAQHFVDFKVLGYIFSLGQQNVTIGFIPFALHHVRRVKQLYKQLFNMDEWRNAELIFGSGLGLKIGSQSGLIGIKALEPKGLKEYIRWDEAALLSTNNEIKNNSNIFHTYLIWILAMLNNQELWDKAQTIASALKAYSDAGGKSTKNRNTVDTVLGATNKRGFIEGLTEVVKNSVDNEAFVDAAKEVNTMPTDNVPYFLTLIRFQYAIL